MPGTRSNLKSGILFVLSCASFLIGNPDLAGAQTAPANPEARRSAAYNSFPDGILLIKARSAAKDMEQPGWIQNAGFYYFTGLGTQPGAILALDGPRKESHLFVPPAPKSFGMAVEGLSLEPGVESAATWGFTSVQPWSAFRAWIEARMESRTQTLYVETPRRSEERGTPSGLLAVSGRFTLWRQALEAAFPDAAIKSADSVLRRMRWQKSPEEIAILRRNAEITAAALVEGARSLKPGVTQRVAEAAVVSGCLAGGAQGPSFWPWMMSGPNALTASLVRSFFDYDGMNRTMQEGELVRVDIGCGAGFYGGDVGRTVPVSGQYTATQRMVWDLLITGYLAGIDAMHAGAPLDSVRAASREAILEYAMQNADSPDVQAVAEAMLAATSGANWHIHGVGIESGEEAVDPLMAGSVIAYEPGFTWKGEAYYLEDMILVRQDDAEVLSRGLPYFATEMEEMLR